MTREELAKRIELTQEQNRAAIEKADAFIREFDRLAAIHNASTDRLLRKLRRAARRY